MKEMSESHPDLLQDPIKDLSSKTYPRPIQRLRTSSTGRPKTQGLKTTFGLLKESTSRVNISLDFLGSSSKK
ncbi:unnamed protein product [Rhodiola kirilowii]